MTREQQAARAALDAHDALRATHESEPPSDDEGMPIDPAAWLNWQSTISVPAYAAWRQAMDDLAATLGREVGRHPLTFRPVCEEILSA